MNGHFRVVVDRQTIENVLLALSRSEQRNLLACFRGLEENPFVRPDYYQRGGTGRDYSLILRRPFKITYWLDHAGKEVRIVDVQKI